MKDLEEKINKQFPANMSKFNQGTWKDRPKNMNKAISVYMTDGMINAIKEVVKSERFPNRSEFIRHLISKYFEHMISDYRYTKRDLDKEYKRGYHKSISEFRKALVEGLEHLQAVDDGVTTETNNLITFEPVQEWFENEIEKWEAKKNE